MKKRITAVALVVILFALLAMGTAAYTYYKYEDRATNIITTNKIEMVLDEHLDPLDWIFPDEGQKNVFTLSQQVYPSQIVDKTPTVTNTGPEPFYTRVKVEVVVTAPDGTILPAQYVQPLFNGDGSWVYADGWYYYNGVLNSAEESTPVFTGVKIDESTPNDYADATVSIVVTSQAVQVKNNPIPAGGITAVPGWPT